MEGKHNLVDLMGIAMGKIKELADVNTIVGAPITAQDNTTIIPVSKCSLGFGAGGSDYGKEPKNFGGGSGGGITLTPVAFLVINASEVKLLPVNPPAGSTVDRVVEMAPGIVERILGFFKKDQDN